MPDNPHIAQIDALLTVYRERYIILSGLHEKLFKMESEVAGDRVLKVKNELAIVASKMAFYEHEIDVLNQMRLRHEKRG